MDSLFHTEEVSQIHTEGISQDWPEAERVCLNYGCTKGFHFQKYEAMNFVWAFPMLVKLILNLQFSVTRIMLFKTSFLSSFSLKLIFQYV